MFLIFAVLTLLGALMMLLQKNVIVAGLCMVMAFLGVAGLFVLLANPVAAALQIIVYAGAILVLVLFVIMLLNTHEEEAAEQTRPVQRWVSVALVALLGLGALFILSKSPTLDSLAQQTPMIAAMELSRVGANLFGGHLVAFEAIGLLLLAAMIGAVALTKKNL
jgi:NADH-quinone oxidoreductase subunit J